MTDPWSDIRREMHAEKARCDREHRVFDVADAMAGLAHALNIPEPRRSIVGALLDGPTCLCGHCD